MEQKVNIGYTVREIRTEQFATFEEHYSPDGKTQLEMAMSFAFEPEKRTLVCIIGFTFTQGDSPFMKIETSCHYELENETIERLTKRENLTIEFPKEFLQLIAVTTLITTRGILAVRTEGTPYSSFILPSWLEKEELANMNLVFDHRNG
jgi:hypothetical protein